MKARSVLVKLTRDERVLAPSLLAERLRQRFVGQNVVRMFRLWLTPEVRVTFGRGA